MRKLNFLLLFCIPFLFTMCEKYPDEITINQSGDVEIKVIDKQGRGIPDAEVGIGQNYNGYLDEGTTNESGIYKSDKLLQGVYTVSARVEKNGMTYSDTKPVHILAKHTRKMELDPMANVGKAALKFFVEEYDYENYEYIIKPAAGLNILLIPDYKYNSQAEVWDLIKLAYFKGKTDAEGRIYCEELPVNDYYLIPYTDNFERVNYYYPSYIRVTKGDEFRAEIEVRGY